MPALSPPVRTMTARILVVDDDADIRNMVEFILADAGYVVTTAADGRAALDAVLHQLPDVILLDLNMPVMTGWEFQEELRRRGIPVPVIFMTAGQRAREEAQRYQVAGYLMKPFD